MVFAGALGSYHESECSLTRKILHRLRPAMLCLADRLFPGYELWKEAPAQELAALHPQRWEIELAIRESREVLRGKMLTLRSKVAELARQELWGLLLALYLVRRTMALAALGHCRDPDTLSFSRSVEIIKSTQAGPVLSFPPKSVQAFSNR